MVPGLVARSAKLMGGALSQGLTLPLTAVMTYRKLLAEKRLLSP